MSRFTLVLAVAGGVLAACGQATAGNSGGPAIGAMMTKPPALPVPFWGYYFNVPSIDAGTEKIKAGGGKILNGPMEVPGGQWIVQAMDPQGAAFSLVAPGH